MLLGMNGAHGRRCTLNSARARLVAWGLAAAWLLLIYCTLPLAETITVWSYRWLDPRWYPLAVGAALAFAGFFCARRLFGLARGATPASWPRRLGLLAVVLGVALAFRAISEPVAKIHLLEYGMLAVLVWRAVRLDVRDRSVWSTSALLCLAGGLGDELIQGFLPARTGELLDVRVNLYATFLALAASALLTQRNEGARLGRVSLRWLAAAPLVCAGLFFAFMSWNPDVHYGHRFRVDPHLTFYSMLSLPQLERADASVDARCLAALTAQYGAQARLHLATMDRWRADGRLSPPTYTLLRHVFLHHEYLRGLMRAGRPADAFREYSVHKSVYLNLLWAYPPRWTDDVEARVRSLIADVAQAPPFESDFIPQATPVYTLTTPGGRCVAYCPLASTDVYAILRADRGLYSGVLSQTRNEAAYEQFLRDHPVEKEPLLCEMRVHLFRRNRYALLGEYRVAWWENEILRRYFGRTLARTPWAWDDAARERVRALVPGVEATDYESPVGDGYIYWASRGGLQAASLIAAAAVALGYLVLRERFPR